MYLQRKYIKILHIMVRKSKKISVSMISKRSGIDNRTIKKFLETGEVRLEKALIIERTICDIKKEAELFNYKAFL